MRLYLAGLFTNGFGNSKYSTRITAAEEQDRSSVRNYLESYHYIHRQKFVDDIRREDRKVFLDSGAFSAFTMGVDVDLPAYCRYIKENEDIIENIDGNVCASVLDSIGSAEGTYENQMKMEKLGVKPLPCFHYGEDEKWLEWYVDKYEHITIGGMVPISTPQLKIWLDRIWEKYLIDGAGRPKIKLHGFGLTTIPLMERYPWYSVDSSSWVQIAANGGILYTKNWKALSVSENSPSRKVHNQHFSTLVPEHQQSILDHLRKQGYSMKRLETEYLSRWAYNCGAFTRLEDHVMATQKDTFTPDQLGLF
jgi:hypothetical protein